MARTTINRRAFVRSGALFVPAAFNIIRRARANPTFFGENFISSGGACTTQQDQYTGATGAASNNVGNLANKSQNWAAIQFQAGASYTLCKVVPLISKVGSPTFTIGCWIYNSSAALGSGNPTTAVTSEMTIAASSLGTTFAGSATTFSGFSNNLTSGTTYFVVLRRTDNAAGDGTNYIQWYYLSSAGNGIFRYSGDGTTWSAFSSNTRANWTTYS